MFRPQIREASKRFLFGNRSYPEIERIGDPHSYWGDIYHLLLTMPWLTFVSLTSLLYLLINALFAVVYSIGGGIATVNEYESAYFLELFFFSVQTMASIGYGAMYPTNLYAHSVVVIESIVSLFFIATTTGLVFARFSLPTARILFSDVAVIAPFNGVPTLMFRAANKRKNYILEAQLWVTLVRDEFSKEGEFMRRFHDVPLVRSHTPVFSLSWTAMHAIEPGGLLDGDTSESLRRDDAQIIVTLTGFDETLAQTIHARHTFKANDIYWNHRFADILLIGSHGKRVINFNQFNVIQPIDDPRQFPNGLRRFRGNTTARNGSNGSNGGNSNGNNSYENQPDETLS
ncbi:MAG: ATP-sensitive inward rectifier potassium channel 10 [Phormidesmis priestleyi]|uniref:ATP-sensitive inward rectifier potassium channel 10 n=1 Tax=Phormidesmis priestleyi TaxID=268141 RepID=A0A2W4XT75_9CYAN|nr:MAG: ATP-sensitive inward rectifier potassium channel 10 [Phormidesmis priestleyi]